MAPVTTPDETPEAQVAIQTVVSALEDTPAESTEPSSDATPKTDTKEGEEEKEEEKKEEDEEKKEEKIVIGSVSEIKELYAKYDKDGNRSWSEEFPDDLVEAAENEKSLKYAVLVRKKKPKEADSTKPLIIDSLIIQSPRLKKVLCKVLKNYPGIVPNVSRLVFYAPFECFVHRWSEFAEELNSTSYDEITMEHLNLLHGILKEELGDIITLRQDYLSNKAVTFEHTWTLFVPGDTILTVKHGKPIAVRFNRGYFGMTQCGRAYQLECECIDWDGLTLGWVSCNLMVAEFVGAKSFTELSCYPIQFHENPEIIKAVLEERGRKFEELCGYHYKSYEGMAFYHPVMDRSKTSSESISTRIVIDAASWEKANPDHQVYPRTLYTNDNSGYRSRRGSVSSDSEDYYSDAGDDEALPANPTLDSDQVLMTVPTIRGYSLRNRRWMEFFVDQVSEVEYDENAFDSLVLEKEQKELILAFAQSQVKFKDAFDDIISGKGKGIIMLLSGGPGIGKTLTAESVAEEMKAPLYVMGAGDLGTEPDELERNLGEILAMVSNWNAVLLLDECDIFLEARSSADMHRNRIVGIFLRMLEYYEGILFLTTNRVKDMDPAFESRIHMSLEYPDLDCNGRSTVWKTFLARAVNADKKFFGQSVYEVSDREIVRLSNLNLNGRQIKNAVKMANLLSCQQGEKLTFTHIQKVLRVQGHSL